MNKGQIFGEIIAFFFIIIILVVMIVFLVQPEESKEIGKQGVGIGENIIDKGLKTTKDMLNNIETKLNQTGG